MFLVAALGAHSDRLRLNDGGTTTVQDLRLLSLEGGLGGGHMGRVRPQPAFFF